MKTRGNPPIAPPSNVYLYFIKTFLKNKSKFTNRKRKLADARRVWKTLSSEERDKFLVRLEESKLEYEQKYAQYLDKLEPYLKKKREDTLKDLDADIAEEDTNAECEGANVVLQNDSTQGDNSSDPDIRDGAETVALATEHPTEKPIPPPKDGKELYIMMQEHITEQDQCLEHWRKLSPAQKSRYRNAVRSLKNDYMDKYKAYLLSLSSYELAEQLKEE